MVNECKKEGSASIVSEFCKLRSLVSCQPTLAPYITHGFHKLKDNSALLYFLSESPGEPLIDAWTDFIKDMFSTLENDKGLDFNETTALPDLLKVLKENHSELYNSALQVLTQITCSVLEALRFLHSKLVSHGALHSERIRVLAPLRVGVQPKM